MIKQSPVTSAKGPRWCASRGPVWTRAVPKKSHIISSQLTEASWLSCSSSCFLKVRLPKVKVHCNNSFSLKMAHKQFDKKLKGKERFFQKPNVKDRTAITTECVEAL